MNEERRGRKKRSVKSAAPDDCYDDAEAEGDGDGDDDERAGDGLAKEFGR